MSHFYLKFRCSISVSQHHKFAVLKLTKDSRCFPVPVCELTLVLRMSRTLFVYVDELFRVCRTNLHILKLYFRSHSLKPSPLIYQLIAHSLLRLNTFPLT